MTKLCIMIGTTIGGYAAWGIGAALGFGFMTNFILSGVGSVVGVYLGWKFAQRFV
ncbi:hypothetical protein GALL_103530 [mine drainage metagenome]|uniref:Uncharacterized protein n=1 Tax=mine drainage metagenome TaxID=410659 RepID=A0A1J5T0M0_9ZZZZ